MREFIQSRNLNNDVMNDGQRAFQDNRRAAHSRDRELDREERRTTTSGALSCAERKNALSIWATNEHGRAWLPAIFIDFKCDRRISFIVGSLFGLFFVRLRYAEAAEREIFCVFPGISPFK